MYIMYMRFLKDRREEERDAGRRHHDIGFHLYVFMYVKNMISLAWQGDMYIMYIVYVHSFS